MPSPRKHDSRGAFSPRDPSSILNPRRVGEAAGRGIVLNVARTHGDPGGSIGEEKRIVARSRAIVRVPARTWDKGKIKRNLKRPGRF